VDTFIKQEEERSLYSKATRMVNVLWKLNLIDFKLSKMDMLSVYVSPSPRSSFMYVLSYNQQANKKGAF
jgi:hypothetical protein